MKRLKRKQWKEQVTPMFRARNIRYENIVVEGFRYGVQVPERGENVIVSGQLNNIDNIVIESARRAGRTVRISQYAQVLNQGVPPRRGILRIASSSISRPMPGLSGTVM